MEQVSSRKECGGSCKVGLKDLLDDTDFSDVTLVCDDAQQLKAHKVVLAHNSTFFRNILVTNPHPYPLLYMKGVKS